jgi:hypothetical protein
VSARHESDGVRVVPATGPGAEPTVRAELGGVLLTDERVREWELGLQVMQRLGSVHFGAIVRAAKQRLRGEQ